MVPHKQLVVFFHQLVQEWSSLFYLRHKAKSETRRNLVTLPFQKHLLLPLTLWAYVWLLTSGTCPQKDSEDNSRHANLGIQSIENCIHQKTLSFIVSMPKLPQKSTARRILLARAPQRGSYGTRICCMT